MNDRLLDQLKPTSYDLDINIDESSLTFNGQVLVKATKAGQSDYIKLHSKYLEIEQVLVNGAEADSRDDFEQETISIKDPDPKQKQKDIRLIFRGTITEPMSGMYPCKYLDEGQQKKIIATQLESHHAREVFPCIDEPAAKATFNLAITCTSKQVVLSNTEAIKTKQLDGNRQKVQFKTTPIMSTYLLAFVVGELKRLKGVSKSGIEVSTWATKDNYKNTSFALDCSIKFLDFYEDYFGINFPLRKCDHVALPEFAAGAMENWGLITYREAVLIVDENTSIGEKQQVAIVIAHELAHQWFGNLVTMQWWEDLWLNEGFASWIEYLAVDKLFPEWQIWQQFTSVDLIIAQKLDSLENTHPIEVKINNPNEIRDIFDAISYQKGASVIRMLHAFVGEENFQSGLKSYLNKYSYNNASTKELYESLEEASGLPVNDFMSKWTSQSGFPFVEVSQRAGKELSFKQQRFLTNPKKRTEQTPTLWPIPLYSHTEQSQLMKDREDSSSYNLSYLNTEQSSFFITKYNQVLIDNFANKIESGQLPATERLGLLNDSFELAKAGFETTTAPLELLNSYSNEESPIVWSVMVRQLSDIRSVMDSIEIVNLQKGFLKNLAISQYKNLSWQPTEDEPYFDSLLRPIIISQMCFANHSPAVDTALKLFNSTTDGSEISPDFRAIVYSVAARNGGQSEFDKLIQMYKASQSPQERDNLMLGLTSFKDKNINQQVISFISDDSVRLQEIVYWVARIFSNRYSKHLAWSWLQDNWQWLVDKFGTDIMSYSRLPSYAAAPFSDQEFLNEYETFFEKAKTVGIDRSVRQGAERIEWQIDWRQRDDKKILDFFKSSQNSQQ